MRTNIAADVPSPHTEEAKTGQSCKTIPYPDQAAHAPALRIHVNLDTPPSCRVWIVVDSCGIRMDAARKNASQPMPGAAK